MRATGRCDTGYQVLGRTPAAKQKSMSLEDNQNIYQSISCKLEFGRRLKGGEAGRRSGGAQLQNGDAWDEEIRDVSCARDVQIRDRSGGFGLSHT